MDRRGYGGLVSDIACTLVQMSLAQHLTCVSGIYVYIYTYIHILACFTRLVSDIAGSLLYFSFCFISELSLLYLRDIPADDLRECSLDILGLRLPVYEALSY